MTAKIKTTKPKKKPAKYKFMGFGASALPEFAKDKRQERWKKERDTRGFDSSELWSLDFTIAKFILPRLKAFRAKPYGYPGSLTEDKWNEILDKMIESFDIIVNDDGCWDIIPEKRVLVKTGFDLFHEYFFHLWQ